MLTKTVKLVILAILLIILVIIFSGCKRNDNQATAEKKSEVLTQQSASESAEKELEALRKQLDVAKQELSQFKAEAEKKEIELLKKEKQDLEQEVKELRLEKERLRSSTNTFQGLVSSLSDIFGKKEAPKPQAEEVKPTVELLVEEVPVLLICNSPGGSYPGSNYSTSRFHLKITNRKTGKFFVYESPRSSYPGSSMFPEQKEISLVPGEYTLEVNRNNSRFSAPRTFTVAEESFVEINGKKYHAVVRY